MRQLCVHRHMKHLGGLKSIQEARATLQTSRVLHVSMNARSRMKQFVIPVESKEQ